MKPFSIKFEIWLLSQFVCFFSGVSVTLSCYFVCHVYIYIWGRGEREISIYVCVCVCIRTWGPQVVLVVKNLPANVGDIRNVGSIPGLIRSLGGGHSNTLQCSCLDNPMDRGAWWAVVHGVAKSQTLLKQLSLHTYTHIYIRAQYICC